MQKESVTYLIKLKHSDFNLYVSNRPNQEDDAKYTRHRNQAREFNGLEKISIDMSHHIAIKKTEITTIEYEEVEYDI